MKHRSLVILLAFGMLLTPNAQAQGGTWLPVEPMPTARESVAAWQLAIWVTVIVVNVMGNFNDWIPIELGDDLDYMEAEKPYLDGKISLSQVATRLDISSNHLSQVINENLNRNFYDFVNGYRVEMVKQKLADPANTRPNILAIAYDSGFSSKSSFNEVFKKNTNLTPSQYRKQLEL